MSIKYRLSLAIIFIVLLAAVPLSLFILEKQEQEKIEQTIKTGKLNTNLLARNSVDIIMKNPLKKDLLSAKVDGLEMLKVFRELKNQGLVFSQLIRISEQHPQMNGVILASIFYKKESMKWEYEKEYQKNKKLKPGIFENLKTLKKYNEIKCYDSNEQCIEFADVGQLTYKGEKIPLVLTRMQFSKTFILEPVRNLRKLIFIAAGIAIAVGILVGHLLSTFISRPIFSLTRGVEHYGKGDLGYRVDIKSQSELGKLANAFNSMASDIQKKIEVIEDHRDNLEQKVKERTKELREKNEQVTASIRYAKKIQNAILPLETQLKESFKEYFIIYKPRDIVSGDFFWFNKLDGKIFFAVIDCTGHGVPGAFMSMIGNAILNQTVNQNKIFQPDIILENLNIGVREALGQKVGEEMYVSDGMDVCLCLIETEKKKVLFSGAKRPLFLLKESTSSIGKREEKRDFYSLLTIKGSRKSIGGRQKEIKRKFSVQEIDIKTGDILYLSTDGFMDQNNNEEKKYGTRRFKELILEIAAHDMIDQKKKIENELALHQGGEAQRDDITLAGIKVL
jgi:serine phosphatase RsbU (regulator of sigma subunit)